MGMLKKILCVLTALVFTVGITACTDGDGGGETVSVTSVSVAETDVLLMLGDIYAVEPEVLPENATNKKLNYSSDAPNVAAVDAYGSVTAAGKGNAVITVSSAENSAVKTTVAVEVRLKSETIKSSVLKKPSKLTYKLGESANYSNGEIEATFMDDTIKVIGLNNSALTVTGFDTFTAGTKTITVTYLNGSWAFDITVLDVEAFKLTSLTDKEYLESSQSSQNTNEIIVQTEGDYKGLAVKTGGSDENCIEIDMYTSKTDIFGVRIKAYSESDGVTFGIAFAKNSALPGNPYQECTYMSHWRGQLFGEIPPLHAANDNIASAKAGEFNIYASFNKVYFGSDGPSIADALSNGETVTLKFNAYGASGATVIFEEIEFVTEAEYVFMPYDDPDAPTETWGSSLLKDAGYVAAYVESYDKGGNATAYSVEAGGLFIANSGYGITLAAFPNSEAKGTFYALKITVTAPKGTQFDVFMKTRSGDIIQTSAEWSWGGRGYMTVPQVYDMVEYTMWIPIPDTSIGFSDTSSAVLAFINDNKAIDITIKVSGGSTGPGCVVSGLEFISRYEYDNIVD